MVRISVEYTGDLHCRAVHGPSGAALPTDAPVDNEGLGASFSPTDLVATAFATCVLTTMGIVARREGIAMEGATASVEKGMSSYGPRRIARLALEVHLPIPRSADPKGVLERAGRACPVHRSLHPEVRQEITFHWRAG